MIMLRRRSSWNSLLNLLNCIVFWSSVDLPSYVLLLRCLTDTLTEQTKHNGRLKSPHLCAPPSWHHMTSTVLNGSTSFKFQICEARNVQLLWKPGQGGSDSVLQSFWGCAFVVFSSDPVTCSSTTLGSCNSQTCFLFVNAVCPCLTCCHDFGNCSPWHITTVFSKTPGHRVKCKWKQNAVICKT